ncbi:hypothetical protein ACWF9G_19070 [Nocardia sp. NPDC055029]
MATPPVEMAAPSGSYIAFYAVTLCSLAVSLSWLTWRSYSARSWLPISVVAGGLAVGTVLPPICNALTYVWFPSNIPFAYITAFGMRDPAFDLLGYAMFFSVGGWYFYEQLRAGRGRRAVWATFAIFAVLDLVLEVPFVVWGLFEYYGDQPFTIAGFPAHWCIMNGAVPIVSGGLLYLAIERWPFGGNVVLRVAAVPLLAGGLLLLPMAPVATALNAEMQSRVRYVAAVATMAICIIAVRFVAECFSESTAGAGRQGLADAA